MQKDVVVTELAEQKRDISYAWQANSEQEAENLVKYLADHGIAAKAVYLSYIEGWN